MLTDKDRTSPMKELADIAGREPTHIFTGADFLSMRRPCVYVWIRGDAVLYVGKGSNGMSRPLDSSHHRMTTATIQPQDRLLIYGCELGEEMTLEAELIRKLRPKFNGEREVPIGLSTLGEVAARLKLVKGTLYNWTAKMGPDDGVYRTGNRTLIDFPVFFDRTFRQGRGLEDR